MAECEPRDNARALAWTVVAVGALAALRIAGLFASPVGLYPEEAQYWVWSRHLAFGYFSKPPMIAWLIAATTAVGGQGEAWVRLSAPLVHAVAALALQRAGARLYGGWAGFAAAVAYSLMPGVQLSSAAIATDAPMLMFVALAVWAYAGLMTARDRGAAMRCAAGLGLALGLGALSKYAALYLVAGLALHAVLDAGARRRWRPAELALAGGLFLVALSPNLAWNAAHGFSTVAHTAADAEWSGSQATIADGEVAVRHVRHFDPRQALDFSVEQFGVFGPIPFAVVLVIAALALARRRREPADGAVRWDRMLLALALPPLAIVLVQALISRANANWAAAAYAPAAVLVGGWLVRRRAWWTAAAAVASQALVGLVFAAVAISPALADQLGVANSFKRARGWREIAGLVRTQAAEASRPAPLSAIAVDDRFLFNALAYYDRDLFAAGRPPLRMWVREARAHNEAETDAPLTAGQGARVLFVDVRETYRREAEADFAAVRPLGGWTVRLDPKHVRAVSLFLGRDFHRRARDPRTGLPVVDLASPKGMTASHEPRSRFPRA